VGDLALTVKLIIEPGDGVERLVKGIRKAKKSVEIVIFRFDRSEIERALIDAAQRGVFVHALIAFTNRGGEEYLRKLEMRFLERGITVARTADDLVRYHGKMMIVDRKELYLLSFNFTQLDINRSRGFGLITRNPKMVAEAEKLFDADTKRQPYSAGLDTFVVSPVNARKELSEFTKGAKKELLIYDVKISDRAMLRLLQEKRKSGVDIRVIGSVSGKKLPVRELQRMGLHTRTIIRDGRDAFIGSQSMRQVELDARREIGIIFRDAKIIKELTRVFDEDWAASSEEMEKDQASKQPPKKMVKKLVKSVAKKLPANKVAKKVAKEISRKADADLDGKKIQERVKEIVEEVVEETAKDAAQDAVKAAAETS
jgi:cardiolipin synthase